MRAWKHWADRVYLVACFALILSTVSTAQEKPSARASADEPGDRWATVGWHDLSGLSPFQRAVYLSDRRAMEWLWRANRPDGLFVHGFNPALNVAVEGDGFLTQCEAAFGLARAARYSSEGRYTVRARQAILALLAETKTDPAEAGVRFPIEPAHRLSAAALLILTVAELPEPGQELLEQSEQLCRYVRAQLQLDGSFRVPESASDADSGYFASGHAVAALVRSQRHAQPIAQAAWKIEAARKALAYYRPRWPDAPSLAFAAGHSVACAEAFALTKEKAFAEFTFEMNDWLCGQQYGLEARQPLWQGGFAEKGKASGNPPGIRSVLAAAALAQGCRAARQVGDVQRFNRYQDALQRCLQFLMTLQYTAANVQHFAESFQPRLVGAFFASHKDGNVTADAAALVVLAMTDYLEHVAQLPARTKQ